MRREQLEQYRSKKEEIRELQYKLKHLGEGDSMIGNDVILDYSTGYPRPQSIVGVDWDKVNRTYERYVNKMARLGKECEEIEEFVESIPDSLTRRIFRMYYIDGMTQEKVAKKIHLDRSRISRKIDDFLKTHTKHTKHMYNNN